VEKYCSHCITNCLLKHQSTKLDKYVVGQKIWRISSCLYFLLVFEWLWHSNTYLYQWQDTGTLILRYSLRSNAESWINSLLFVCLVVFNAIFNNISVISRLSVLLVEETGGHRENHRPVVSHWQTLSHNVVHLALIDIWTPTTIGSRPRQFFKTMFLLHMFDLSFYNKLKLSTTICDGSALDAELCQYHAWFLVKQAKIDKTECTKRWVRVMAFNATFINISVVSWWSVLFVEDTGVPGENHRPVASHWQTLLHKVQ
jgi:hypothetical protein